MFMNWRSNEGGPGDIIVGTLIFMAFLLIKMWIFTPKVFHKQEGSIASQLKSQGWRYNLPLTSQYNCLYPLVTEDKPGTKKIVFML